VRQLTGWLLVVGSAVFMVGAANPVLAKAWSAPQETFLAIVGGHRRAWATTSILFIAAAVVTTPGLVLLAPLVPDVEASGFAVAGAVTFAIASVIWVITCVHRLTVQAWAAQQYLATGAIDRTTEPLDRLAGGLFQAFIVLAFAGLAVIGVAAATGGLLAVWLGWLVAGFAAAMVGLLYLTGDMPPFAVFVPTLALGVAMLVN
jgi:hypothetical protein